MMAGPADSDNNKDTSSATAATEPATAVEEQQEEQQEEGGRGGHPYGVKPWGNFLTDAGDGEQVGLIDRRGDVIGVPARACVG
jgi:hypothetical protein